MRNGKRGRYRLEFKQEAVRVVESGQSLAEAARSLGVVEQTLSNWVKAHRAGRLKEVGGKAGVTAEQMEISRLRAEHRARRRRIAERRHWSDQARLTHSSAVYAEHIAGPAAGRASGGS